MNTVASVVFWVVLCLLVGAGCGGNAPEHRDEADAGPAGPCDRTFLVSREFPLEERAALGRAVRRWNAIAIQQFCLEDAGEEIEPSTAEHAIFRIAYKGEYWKRVSESMGNVDFIGVYWGGPDVIGIVDSMPIDQFERVALHELGHAHGLSHTDAPAIMHAYEGTASDFTDKDIAECKRVGACASDVAASSSENEPSSVWVLQ